MAAGILIDALLGQIRSELERAQDARWSDDTTLTPEMGALVRDKGADVARTAAQMRRAVGFLHEMSNLAEYVDAPAKSE